MSIFPQPVFGDPATSHRLYLEAGAPTSLVPIAEVLIWIRNVSGGQAADQFSNALFRAIKEGRAFDEADLQFLALGEAVPYERPHSEFLKARSQSFKDPAQCRADYVENALIDLASLQNWCAQIGQDLPAHLSRASTSPATRSGSSARANGGGRPPNSDKQKFSDECERLVADGLHADPTVANQTQAKMVNALCDWASKNMQKPYQYGTIFKYVQKNWAAWQSSFREAAPPD